MAHRANAEDDVKSNEAQPQMPGAQIFLQPIAPPAALGLAGFASSTWIMSSYIAQWWGTDASPTLFFPFVGLFGGLAQFIAGIYGFSARDTLVTVINTMWGSFWMSMGILFAMVAAGVLEPHSSRTHFPELASWFVILTIFTWSCALAAIARDVVLSAALILLAIGSTIACSLFARNGGEPSASGDDDGTEGGVAKAMVAASYLWMLAALLGWYRCTAYLVEEAFGPGHSITKLFPIGRTMMEKRAPLAAPGLGEPGVKRGMPKPVSV